MLLLALPVRGQDARTQIQAEIQRLQKSVKDNPITDSMFAGLSSAINSTLDESAQALAVGRLYLSLEKLQQAEDLLQGARLAMDKDEVTKQGLPAFEARWAKANLTLTALEERSRSKDWSRSPALVRALWEAAQGSAAPLMDGGRAFATISGPAQGLFNLGQGMGEVEFASFVASLNFPRGKPIRPFRSILPELAALQTKANAAFQPPKSIEMESQFIALNSALKVAQELDARKFYAGALYQYLQAVQQYGVLVAAPGPDASTDWKSALQANRSKLKNSSTDDSIAELFQQRAETFFSQTDGSNPDHQSLAKAIVVLNDVQQAYFAVNSAPSPAHAAPSAKTHTLTLVRWPYT